MTGDPGYRVLQTIPGVGPVLSAVFVAVIGDVHRFAGPDRVASWAGLIPRHRESDTTVHRGHITKQGSRLVRWAAVEAVQRVPKSSRLGQRGERVASRRGRNIGKVAPARELIPSRLLRAARRAHPRPFRMKPTVLAVGRGSCKVMTLAGVVAPSD